MAKPPLLSTQFSQVQALIESQDFLTSFNIPTLSFNIVTWSNPLILLLSNSYIVTQNLFCIHDAYILEIDFGVENVWCPQMHPSWAWLPWATGRLTARSLWMTAQGPAPVRTAVKRVVPHPCLLRSFPPGPSSAWTPWPSSCGALI